MNKRLRLSGKAPLVRGLLISGLLLGFFCAAALAGETAPGPATPAENTAHPGEGFVALFDGSSFDGWKHLEGFEGHWVAKDGVISCDGKVKVKRGGERSLWTEKEYTDFILLVDWRLTRKPVRQPMNDFTDDGLIKRDKDGKRITHEVLHAGDSGIYLRGDPRTQVNIWCQPMGSGDINSYHKDARLPEETRRACMPKLNADNPPGQWNRFVITMRGAVVTVVLNGKTVIDRAALPGVAARGPIGLQNHGDPMEFRNLFIKPLPDGSPE
jgi:hypothetical protein